MRKRRLISHLISLGFVVGVAGFAYYEYVRSHRVQKEELEASYFLNQTLALSKLYKIEIKKERENILVEKENNNWVVKKPLKDESSFSEVSRWFDEIKNQKVKQIVIDGDIPWKDYYLENSPQVILHFLGKEPVEFFISSKESFDGKFFLKKEGKLFIGEQYFSKEVVNKTADSFRNKKITPSYGHPDKMTIDQKDRMSFGWEDYKWTFQDKDIPLDSNLLDQFWMDVSSLKSSSFKGLATAQALERYGLSQPQDKIILHYKPNKKIVIKISSLQKDKAFIHSSHRKYILEISKKDREKLLLPKNEIYDYTKFFNYKKEQAAYLKFQSSKKSYTLEKKGNQWVASNSLNREVDPEKVKILLNSIYDLKGKNYKKTKLKNPKSSLVIKDSSGQDLLKMDIGASAHSLVWIQTQLFKGQVALAQSSLDFLYKGKIFSPTKTK